MLLVLAAVASAATASLVQLRCKDAECSSGCSVVRYPLDECMPGSRGNTSTKAISCSTGRADVITYASDSCSGTGESSQWRVGICEADGDGFWMINACLETTPAAQNTTSGLYMFKYPTDDCSGTAINSSFLPQSTCLETDAGALWLDEDTGVTLYWTNDCYNLSLANDITALYVAAKTNALPGCKAQPPYSVNSIFVNDPTSQGQQLPQAGFPPPAQADVLPQGFIENIVFYDNACGYQHISAQYKLRRDSCVGFEGVSVFVTGAFDAYSVSLYSGPGCQFLMKNLSMIFDTSCFPVNSSRYLTSWFFGIG